MLTGLLQYMYPKINKTSYTLRDCAYIGDDIVDLQCMIPIRKAGGILGCPADAVDEVKEISDFISDKCGENGADRQFIQWITAK